MSNLRNNTVHWLICHFHTKQNHALTITKHITQHSTILNSDQSQHSAVRNFVMFTIVHSNTSVRSSGLVLSCGHIYHCLAHFRSQNSVVLTGIHLQGESFIQAAFALCSVDDSYIDWHYRWWIFFAPAWNFANFTTLFCFKEMQLTQSSVSVIIFFFFLNRNFSFNCSVHLTARPIDLHV